MIQAPYLRYFDEKKYVTLSVDASKDIIRTVLLQEMHPVSIWICIVCRNPAETWKNEKRSTIGVIWFCSIWITTTMEDVLQLKRIAFHYLTSSPKNHMILLFLVFNGCYFGWISTKVSWIIFRECNCLEHMFFKEHKQSLTFFMLYYIRNNY